MGPLVRGNQLLNAVEATELLVLELSIGMSESFNAAELARLVEAWVQWSVATSFLAEQGIQPACVAGDFVPLALQLLGSHVREGASHGVWCKHRTQSPASNLCLVVKTK